MKINSDGTITGEAIIKPEGPIEVSYRQAQDSSIGRDDERIVTETLFSYRESGTGIWKATDPRDFDVPFTETTSFTLDPISNFPGPAKFVHGDGVLARGRFDEPHDAPGVLHGESDAVLHSRAGGGGACSAFIGVYSPRHQAGQYSFDSVRSLETD